MEKLEFNHYPLALSIFKPIYEPFHTTNSLDIIFILQGSLTFKIVHSSKTLNKGEFEFINVNELISLKRNKNETIAALLSIEAEFIKEHIPDIKSRLFNCNLCSFYSGGSTERNLDELKVKIQNIIARMFFNSFFAEETTITAKMLLKFFQDEFEDIKNVLKNVDKTFHQDRFVRIDTYLRINSKRHISLDDISDNEFLSIPYLSKEFSRLLKRNFKEILAYYRVVHASTLLLETTMSVSDISVESGFSGNRYFYKYFKRFIKMTPSEFRKLQKNKPYKYEEIFDHDKKSIKNIISGFTVEKKYSEKIVIRHWAHNKIDELEKKFSIELNIIAEYLKNNFYSYNLLKIVENISISSCRFIFKSLDNFETGISDIFDILNFIFQNFKIRFKIIIAFDFPAFSDIEDAFLDNAIKDIVQRSANMSYDIHFKMLAEYEDKGKLKRLFPEMDTLLKPDMLGKTQAMTPSEFIHHVKSVKNSGIDVFPNIMDASSIGIDSDRAILLFDDQFVMTPYFKIIYMLSLLNESIISRTDAVHLTNNYEEYAICSINHIGYSFFLYNSNFDNDKIVEVVIEIPNKDKNQSNCKICTTVEKSEPRILLYKKTNIYIQEKILLEHGIVPCSFSKQSLDISTNIVTKDVSEYNRHYFVVTLEPGDIIVLNVAKGL